MADRLDGMTFVNRACFLASAESAYVNGAVWLIDGGLLAWRGAR